MSESVMKRYASALFEVADSRGKVDEIEGDLASVARVFQDKEIDKVFTNPRLENKQKKALIDSFSYAVADEVANVLKVLVDHHREQDLQAISQEYTVIANESRGIASATVTTAVPLSDEDKRQLEEQFGSALNKKLRIDAKVDQDVIGGVLVRIGNRVYDGSIAGKLSRFKQRLSQVR